MMKVLMINPNRFRPNVAPIGLEYVCNSLLRENIDFDVVDRNFEPEKVIYRKLNNTNVDIVGITVRNVDSVTMPKTELFQPGIKRLVEQIKNTKDCKVVLGGAGFSVIPQEILEYSGADFGVVGYGEEAMPKLVRAIREGGNLESIDNLLWRKNGKFKLNPISIGNYENLPARRRNIMRNRSYFKAYGIGNIEEKRGCTNRCGFCCDPNITGCKVVTRRISSVMAELKELKSLGISHIYFCDSEFNVGDPEYSMEFCKQLIKSRVGITWTAGLHPDPRTMSQKLLYLMKDAGCTEVFVSADSGSNEILESMGKTHSAEDTVVCTEYIRKAKIHPLATYVVGWPGESKETIKESFAHVKRCQFETAVFFSGVRIFPNTKLARIAIKEGVIHGDAKFIKPLFYQPERVLREFSPLVRHYASQLSDSNCLYATSAVNFLNLFIRNVYLRGNFSSSGFADFLEHINSLSLVEKLKIFGKTALDYVVPARSRFIPIAEAV